MPLALIKTAQAAIVFILFILTGCASTRLVDAQVNSFAPQKIAAGATYQFERLPSQAANAANQDKLEALTQQALSKVGLTKGDAAPLRVQVTAAQRQETLLTDDGMRFGVGLGWVFGHGGMGLGHHGTLFPGLDSQPNYWRQVSLIMRDHNGNVLFESHASNDGPWSDSVTVFGALLDAALEGFPQPPAGVRRVNIEIPR
jgi:hypothetical protein